LLRPLVTNRLNLEMAAVDAIADLACEIKPDEATLVPERREELTTEGGLDIIAHEAAVGRIVQRLKACDVQVSLFIDPNAAQIHQARMLGAHAVEIQTARYAEAKTKAAREEELSVLREAALLARDQGLHVHMGHGLNYNNVQAAAAIEEVEELNIGHSIVARAVLVGMERAVRDMKEAMRQSRG
jgi:pyridoxine 5-phosphate synthase